VFDRQSKYYSFNIDGYNPQKISSAFINSDFGDKIIFQYSKINTDPTFKEYRIFYNTQYPAIEGQQWDSDNDANLSDINTIYTYVKNLDPNKNYYFNISPVDKVNQINPMDEDILLKRNEIGQPAKLIKFSNDIDFIQPNTEYVLQAQILDSNNNPVQNVQVDFSKISGLGNFSNSENNISAVTNIGGVAEVKFITSDNIFENVEVIAAISEITDTTQFNLGVYFDIIINSLTSNSAVYENEDLNYKVNVSYDNNTALTNTPLIFKIYKNTVLINTIEKYTNSSGNAEISLDSVNYSNEDRIVIYSYLKNNINVYNQNVFYITASDNDKEKIIIEFFNTIKK
jgi:hypothetical protein